MRMFAADRKGIFIVAMLPAFFPEVSGALRRPSSGGARRPGRPPSTQCSLQDSACLSLGNAVDAPYFALRTSQIDS